MSGVNDPKTDSRAKQKINRLGYLDFMLTERCNNDCVHCYINLPAADAAAKSEELNTRELESLFQQAADYGFLRLRFTGGEPLLREDFETLYIYAKKLGFRIKIFTNATLISSHIASMFQKYPPQELVEITVYGMTKAAFEASTCRLGSYGAFKAGLDNLVDNHVPFLLKWVCLQSNKHEYEDFVKWAESLGAAQKDHMECIRFFDLRARTRIEKNTSIERQRMPAEENLRHLIMSKGSAYAAELKNYLRQFSGCSGDGLFPCASHVSGGSVDPYGKFSTCLNLLHPDYNYDLRRHDLKEALDLFAPRIQQLKAQNPDYLRKCAKCFLKALCNQCPVKGWLEHRRLDQPVEYYCEFAHAQARYLGLLGERECAWDVVDWRERVDALSMDE